MLNNDANIKLLSDTFVNILKNEMSADDFENMKKLNQAEIGKPICHSHDFTDANMIMLNAFGKCFPETEFNFDDENHIELFNKAWSLAKRNGQI